MYNDVIRETSNLYKIRTNEFVYHLCVLKGVYIHGSMRTNKRLNNYLFVQKVTDRDLNRATFEDIDVFLNNTEIEFLREYPYIVVYSIRDDICECEYFKDLNSAKNRYIQLIKNYKLNIRCI